jgi:hypothetical protein
LETYTFHKIKSDADWVTIFNFCNQNLPNASLDIASLIENVAESEYANPSFWGKSCINSKRLAISIQYMNGVRTLQDLYNSNYAAIKYDLPSILYQVYFVLSTLNDTYTHYDLHSGNVMVYKPFNGNKYVLMRYHSIGGQVITFKSEYISKIIDYGRNYFKTATNNTEAILKNHVCKEVSCNPSCGSNQGYDIIKGNVDNPKLKFHHIFPNKPNISHDLRLLNTYLHYFKTFLPTTKIVYSGQYGTRPLKTSKANEVRNIHDAKQMLGDLIRTVMTTKLDKKYDSTWEKAAEMDVYADGRPYTFKYNLLSEEQI